MSSTIEEQPRGDSTGQDTQSADGDTIPKFTRPLRPGEVRRIGENGQTIIVLPPADGPALSIDNVRRWNGHSARSASSATTEKPKTKKR